MLSRKSEESSLLESSLPLDPLDTNERDNFLGTSYESKGEMKKSSSHNPSPSAVIGPKIRFKGELFGEEDLLVQGQIDGTIELNNHNLTVGKQGVIKANVTAKTIIIEGKVAGDIFGEDVVSIRKSSNVQGNINAARVILEDGAKFRGSIDMDTEPKSQSKTKTKAQRPLPPQQPPSSDAGDVGKETH